MNAEDDELAQLLEKAVKRLSTARRTFTAEEALAEVWEDGFDISLQADPQGRFVLAYEADSKHPRQWRLATQALANNRLLDALKAGAWDGQKLDAELSRLEAEDQIHYIYCPTDSRFTTLPNGALEAADHEYNLTLAPETQAALDALGQKLVERWHNEGDTPLTVHQVTELLGSLGWSEASERNGWLLVRAWLLAWKEVARVGQDYWVLTRSLPEEPEHTRLQVLAITSQPTPAESLEQAQGEIVINEAPGSSERESALSVGKGQVRHAQELVTHAVSWTYALRTIHLLEGFIPVPSPARSAYPPRVVGTGERAVLKGLWYDSAEPLWLWLDRAQDRLYGPDLAQQLTWLEAGNLLRVEWRSDVVVLRMVGHNDEVQREEMRLVDPQTLKALRGGLGESYRQSLQAMLLEKTEGLTFLQIVKALRERQGHDMHRGTVRALLYAGGFVQRKGHWFAAPHDQSARRTLRDALVETLVAQEEGEDEGTEPTAETEQLRKRVKAIRGRLAELVGMLRI
ncbi:MAG: hypothetical protein NVSMB27_39080 [Ktedonobacteraceae bacterium]